MKNEIEAQFLDINKNKIRKQLDKVGAELVKPEVLMKRVVFDLGPNQYVRVRDEGGGKIVITYKNIEDDNSIMGTKEINITIDDYEQGVELFRACGLSEKAEQESLRETWIYKDGDDEVEICIDTWPWIPTFVEVEGPSEELVWRVAEKLGLSRENAKFGSVDTTYQHYFGVDTDVVNYHTPKILFNMEPPEWAKGKE